MIASPTKNTKRTLISDTLGSLRPHKCQRQRQGLILTMKQAQISTIASDYDINKVFCDSVKVTSFSRSIECARLVIWNATAFDHTLEFINILLRNIKDVLWTHNCLLDGFVHITNTDLHRISTHKNKTSLSIIGVNAYKSAQILIQSKSFWHLCSFHNREWYCSNPCCINVLCHTYNIGKVCQGCNQKRPSTLSDAIQFQQAILTKSLEVESAFVSTKSQHKLGPIDKWKYAIKAAYPQSKTFKFAYVKAPLAQMLTHPCHRLWAIDYHPNKSGKHFIWSCNVMSMLQVYLSLAPTDRNLYEVIPFDRPCHMVYDLDMYISNTVNINKDDKKMVDDISEL